MLVDFASSNVMKTSVNACGWAESIKQIACLKCLRITVFLNRKWRSVGL